MRCFNLETVSYQKINYFFLSATMLTYRFAKRFNETDYIRIVNNINVTESFAKNFNETNYLRLSNNNKKQVMGFILRRLTKGNSF